MIINAVRFGTMGKSNDVNTASKMESGIIFSWGYANICVAKA
jgi:hypothetical protein